MSNSRLHRLFPSGDFVELRSDGTMTSCYRGVTQEGGWIKESHEIVVAYGPPTEVVLGLRDKNSEICDASVCWYFDEGRLMRNDDETDDDLALFYDR